jgi:hypothetical protein
MFSGLVKSDIAVDWKLFPVNCEKLFIYYDSAITGSMNDNINMDSAIVESLNDNINMDSAIVGSMNVRS